MGITLAPWFIGSIFSEQVNPTLNDYSTHGNISDVSNLGLRPWLFFQRLYRLITNHIHYRYIEIGERDTPSWLVSLWKLYTGVILSAAIMFMWRGVVDGGKKFPELFFALILIFPTLITNILFIEESITDFYLLCITFGASSVAGVVFGGWWHCRGLRRWFALGIISIFIITQLWTSMGSLHMDAPC